MDPSQVLEFKRVTEDYLEKNNIYPLFQELIEGLILQKPKDPISYLMNRITGHEVYSFFFVSPPGSGAGSVLQEICTEKGGSFMNFGQYIGREISEGTDSGKEFEKCYKDRRLFIGEKSTQLFCEAYSGCLKNGKDVWIEGFPKTKLQALNMRQSKILPNLMILINRSRETCVGNLVKDLVEKEKISEESALVKANESVDEYYHFLKGVKEIYASNILEVDFDDSNFKKIISKVHKYTTYKTAPRRSPRIFILGPVGSGKSTVTKAVCDKYNFSLISFTHLLREYQKVQNGERNTDLGNSIHESIISGELVEDGLANMILSQRLVKKDVHILGFVLDGYPKTPDQIQWLEEMLNVSPSHIFMLNCPLEQIKKRVEGRMRDPITLEKYNHDEVADLEPEVSKRLAPITEETEENLARRYARWEGLEKNMRGKYSHMMFDIDATLSPENIVEKITFHLEKEK
jgi:adenylate kinase